MNQSNPIKVEQDAELAQAVAGVTDRIRECPELSDEELLDGFAGFREELRGLLPVLRAMAGDPEDAPPPSTDLFELQGTIGDFRLVQVIGRGGMGVVYEAEQISLRRRVALKALPFAGLADERALQRFQNEARAAATLHHPNVVPVFFVGTEKNIHYFVMQLIDGPSLADVIQGLRIAEKGSSADGSTSGRTVQTNIVTDRELQAAISTVRENTRDKYFRQVADWIAQAADGLAYAHEHGILHRDVKPGNLLLDRKGTVWVTDFGLARLDADASMTASGDLLGTLRYMAPEQALGQGSLVDQRADVFGLGLTLFELLTLRPGYSASSREDLLHQIAEQEVDSVRAWDDAIPVDLETIVLKATARDTNDRYLTAQALADDLRQFLAGRVIAAKRPSALSRARKWAARHQALVSMVAATVVVASLVIAISQYLANQRITQKNRELEIARKEAEDTLLLATEAVSSFYARFRGEVLGPMRASPGMGKQYDWFYAETARLYRELVSRQPANDQLRSEAASAIFSYADHAATSPKDRSAAAEEALDLIIGIDLAKLTLRHLHGCAQVASFYLSYNRRDENKRDAVRDVLLRVVEEFTVRMRGNDDPKLLWQLAMDQTNLGFQLYHSDPKRLRRWVGESIDTNQRALRQAIGTPREFLIRASLVKDLLRVPGFVMLNNETVAAEAAKQQAIAMIEPVFAAQLPEQPPTNLVEKLIDALYKVQQRMESIDDRMKYIDRLDEITAKYAKLDWRRTVERSAYTKHCFLMYGQLDRAQAANERCRLGIRNVSDEYLVNRDISLADCYRFEALLLAVQGMMDEAVELLLQAPYGPAQEGSNVSGTRTWNDKVGVFWSMTHFAGTALNDQHAKFDVSDMRYRVRDTMMRFIDRHDFEEADIILQWMRFAYGEEATAALGRTTLSTVASDLLENWGDEFMGWRSLGPVLFVDKEPTDRQALLCERLVGRATLSRSMHGENEPWHSLLGFAYLRLGKPEQAISAFQKANEQESFRHPLVEVGQMNNQLGLAIAHQRAGQTTAARTAFQTALQGAVREGAFLPRGTVMLVREAATDIQMEKEVEVYLQDKAYAGKQPSSVD